MSKHNYEININNMKKKFLFALLPMVAVLLTSCSKSDSDDSDVQDERLESVVPAQYQSTLLKHIPNYKGVNPPILEGNTYLISPKVLVYNSNENDTVYKPGNLYSDNYMQFTNLNTKRNTIDFMGYEVDSGKKIGEQIGDGASISGEGNNFTIFVITTYNYKNATMKRAQIISGTKTDQGLTDLYYGFLCVEKDDPYNKLMKVGEYRIFKDQDGLVELTTLPSNLTRVLYGDSEGQETYEQSSDAAK